MIVFPIIVCLVWPCLNPTPWYFAVIGDTQSRPRIFRRALTQMKKHPLDFAIHLGDIYWCGSIKVWKKRKRLAQSAIPKWYWVIGNHELYTCSRPHRIRPSYRTKWLRIFYGGRGSTERMFTHKGWTFFLLDSATPIIPHCNTCFLGGKNGKKAILTHRPLPTPSNFLLGSKKGLRRRSRDRKIDSGWYSRLGPLPFRGQNRKLWGWAYNNRRKIKAVFHGHHHAFKRYVLPGGIRAWCSGGGGGRLARGHFCHWLLIKVQGNQMFVEVKRIR